MSLFDTIQQDWIAARKARNTNHANILGVLVATLQTKQKDGSRAAAVLEGKISEELTDGEIIQEVKKLRDGISESKKLTPDGHPNHEKLSAEDGALAAYTPTQLSDDELSSFITEKKAEGHDFGKIMASLKATHLGKYDGKKAADFVKSILAKA